MIKSLLILVCLVVVGCGPDTFLPPIGLDDSSTGGMSNTGGEVSIGDTGGSDNLSTGGVGSKSSTGGADGGTGGSTGGATGNTGGESPVDDDSCFPQWDETVTYKQPASVQVGEKIYQLCGSYLESIPGEGPSSDEVNACVLGWRYEANCPSTKCEDALLWDTTKILEFSPAALAGTLFVHNGQVWEMESDVTSLSTGYCPPNPDPEHWCGQPGGLESKFHLAEHCL